MKRRVDLVMFDLDGTLADTGQDLADSINWTRAHFDLAPLAERRIYDHVGRGVEHLLRQAVPVQNGHPFREILRVFLKRYEAHLLDKTTLYPGVREALDHFRDKRRVVVSNKIHRLTAAVVRGLGIEKQFDAIFGGDSAVAKKPHPALLNLVLERFAVAAPKALMVGDADVDVAAGKRAGVVTCGVTDGLGDREQLIATKPDVLIERVAELPIHFC